MVPDDAAEGAADDEEAAVLRKRLYRDEHSLRDPIMAIAGCRPEVSRGNAQTMRCNAEAMQKKMGTGVASESGLCVASPTGLCLRSANDCKGALFAVSPPWQQRRQLQRCPLLASSPQPRLPGLFYPLGKTVPHTGSGKPVTTLLNFYFCFNASSPVCIL